MTTLMASNERVWGTYHSDDGNDYNISCKANVVAAAGNAPKLGYTLGSALQTSIPNGIRPRKVKCTAEGLPARYVICYTTDATLWTTAGTTIDLFSHGNDVTYTSTKDHLGEKHERNMAQP